MEQTTKSYIEPPAAMKIKNLPPLQQLERISAAIEKQAAEKRISLQTAQDLQQAASRAINEAFTDLEESADQAPTELENAKLAIIYLQQDILLKSSNLPQTVKYWYYNNFDLFRFQDSNKHRTVTQPNIEQ